MKSIQLRLDRSQNDDIFEAWSGLNIKKMAFKSNSEKSLSYTEVSCQLSGSFDLLKSKIRKLLEGIDIDNVAITVS